MQQVRTDEAKHINLEHECHLLNQHELSKSQKYELQRFIDQNSHLLRSPNSQGTGDSLTWEKDKGEDRSNSYQRNYGTLSISPNRGRKEVKWSDDVYQPGGTVRRTSSLSPNWSAPSNPLQNSSSSDNFYNLYNNYNNSSNGSTNTMSYYGNTGYMNRGRDNQFPAYSPSSNYQSFGKHPDDYNRYETARSRSHASQRQREEDERSRFSGYGDRPGSGVEFMPTKWHGGEIITDPGHLPRSLKPRRLYYSPIGDGVVAADGVELKRAPKDLSPKITVTHCKTLDRGEPGHDGYNIYARTTTHGNDYGSDMGGSGRDSRLTGGMSPGTAKGYDIESHKTGVDGYGAGIRGTDSYGAGSRGMDLHGTGSPNYRYHSPTAAYQYSPAYHHDSHSTQIGFTPSDPFVSESRGRSQSADLLNGPDNYGDYGFKSDGRSSDGSALHDSIRSERYRKFDVTKDYLITNPRELIHQYATTTPVSILEIPETSSRTVKKMYSSTTEEKYVPYPPYKGSSAVIHPNNFVRQLRDEGLTVSQREANRHQNPLTTDDPEMTHKISEIRKEASRTGATNKEIDHLTEKMMSNLQSGQPTPLHY
uniref:ZM domain-containing protein n=1 Tax=Elaeophora elaphi TaxID=1147741 RepID=A0A0R3S5T8_9BILA